MPASPPVRLLAGAAAALAAVFLLARMPAGLVRGGHPGAAGTLVLVSLPFVAFLGALALAPRRLQELLARRGRVDLSDDRHVAAAVVMAATLFFVLGLGALVEGVYALEEARAGEADLGRVDPQILAWSLAQNLAVLILPALFYVSVVHGVGAREALRRLGLRSEGAGVAVLTGFAATLLFLMALAVASALLGAAGLRPPENERALAIARSVTVVGAFAIAAASSLSEEVFFRGFLQPRIGLVAQAAIFSLAHLSYVNVLEVVVTFALGLVFGLMYRRGGNLWAPIAAHFLFNLLMLLLGVYSEELGLEPRPEQ